MKKAIISIGFDKNGDADFAISDIESLSFEKMSELRAMIIVAIGTAEMMWRSAREKENTVQVNTNKD